MFTIFQKYLMSRADHFCTNKKYNNLLLKMTVEESKKPSKVIQKGIITETDVKIDANIENRIQNGDENIEEEETTNIQSDTEISKMRVEKITNYGTIHVHSKQGVVGGLDVEEHTVFGLTTNGTFHLLFGLLGLSVLMLAFFCGFKKLKGRKTKKEGYEKEKIYMHQIKVQERAIETLTKQIAEIQNANAIAISMSTSEDFRNSDSDSDFSDNETFFSA